jgi:N-methylhydantoinase A
MVRAIRAVSVERGHDPRHFALVAFGGAGALHGVEVARQLGINEVIVPRSPGILCAHGLIVADLKESFVTTHRVVVDRAPIDELHAPLDGLIAAARDWYAREGIAADARQTTLALDMRYLGQNYEIEVEIDTAEGERPPRLPDVGELKRRFFAEHERAYGHHDPDAAVELVNLRVTAVGQLARPAAPAQHSSHATATPKSHRPVWFDGEAPADTPVYARADLAPGAVISGPAIVDQLDATTVLWPNDTGRVDDGLNLIIEVAA